MENKNQPLSPHLQIYRWHISSLLSISNRIIGIINFIFIIILSFLLIFNGTGNQFFKIFIQSFFGKFFIITLCWTFSFQILNEIRHLVWDIGFGFDLKISKITGILTIIGSFILAAVFYSIGRSLI
tara:strand:- start:2669 stop:3046 length:378 start_codon:yes stop_codon:yes gene_type:complete